MGQRCLKFRWWAVASAAVWLVMAGPAGARVLFDRYYSVEWLAADSPMIARCRVISDPTTRPNAYPRCELEVIEALKGSPARTMNVVVRNGVPPGGWLRKGAEVLLFVYTPNTLPPGAPVGDGVEYHALLPLDTKLPARFYSMDMTQVESGARVLELTRTAIRYGTITFPPHTKYGEISVCPPEFEAGHVWVPVDARLQALAERWVASPDPTDGWRGLEAIYALGGEANIERVRGLLADCALAPVVAPGPRGAARDFYIRRIAYALLQQWRIPCQEPELSAPATVYTDRSRRAMAALLAPVIGAVLVALLAWRTRFRIGVGGTVALACTIAAALLLGLGRRSAGMADDLLISPNLALTSTRGWLTLQVGDVVLPGVKFPPKVSFLALACDGEFLPQAAAWRESQVSARINTPVLRYGTGRPGVGVGLVVSVPHLGLAGLLAMGPAAALGRLAYRRLRTRRRRQAGLCGGCGYDLRGAASERCPECGDAVVDVRRNRISAGEPR